MSEIVELDEHLPHRTGKARCIACRHSWVFVAPLTCDLTTLECPLCNEQRSIVDVS